MGRLFGYGWEGEQPFLVLEKLDGETLAALLRREKRLPAARLVDWVEQLLIGLRDCHAVNVIHRDIKPANIFLVQPPGGDAPVVKLIDFGVARLSAIASAGASLTSANHLIGSMGYMAPEQLEYAKGVGPAADLYAVGAVVFRCLTGRLPFVARSFEAIMKLKAEATAPAGVVARGRGAQRSPRRLRRARPLPRPGRALRLGVRNALLGPGGSWRRRSSATPSCPRSTTECSTRTSG